MEKEKSKAGRHPIGANVCYMQFSLTCEQKEWLKQKKNASRWLQCVIDAEMAALLVDLRSEVPERDG